jgi:hypothetical protein
VVELQDVRNGSETLQEVADLESIL